MNILGYQPDDPELARFDRDEEGNIYKDGPRHTSKLGLGSGLLYKLSDKFDLKLTYKNLGNITTNELNSQAHYPPTKTPLNPENWVLLRDAIWQYQLYLNSK